MQCSYAYAISLLILVRGQVAAATGASGVELGKPMQMPARLLKFLAVQGTQAGDQSGRQPHASMIQV